MRGGTTPNTNQIVHQGVTNILGQATKLVRVRCAIQEPRDLASLFQRDEFFKDIVKFPSR